jgi:hypothetical protein
MGESYCNDGSCGLTRRGQIHPAHVGAPPSIEKLDRNEIVENPVVGGLYCNDGNCPLTRRGEKRHRVHIGVLAADADTQDYCDIKYIGGHKAHPSAIVPVTLSCVLFTDQLVGYKKLNFLPGSEYFFQLIL